MTMPQGAILVKVQKSGMETNVFPVIHFALLVGEQATMNVVFVQISCGITAMAPVLIVVHTLKKQY